MDTLNSGLTVCDLGMSYGPLAVIDRISFDLPPGAFFTLLGPSGCGKTTTLRCIAGLAEPHRGSIRIGGEAVFDAQAGLNVPLDRRNFGMVFQSYAIWPHLSVFENVAFPLRVSQDERFASDRIKAMVEEALSTVGLGHLAARSATQLSGGQQQRVALARAIVRRPRLLMLDEPLSNLDAVLREEMRVELKRLQQQLGITTVYVTHDQSEALEMSDAIAVLNRGRVVQIGAPPEVYFNPCDTFVAGFMGSPNILKAAQPGAVSAGELREVALADGRMLTCRFPHDIAATQSIAVSVRPEAFSVAAAGSPARPGWNRLEGVVASTGFQGQAMRYGIDAGAGIMLQASGGYADHFNRGELVALDFPPEAALGLADNASPATPTP
jgi:iron(III) transport system ATP-binding protein